jgi:hypothetical protein
MKSIFLAGAILAAAAATPAFAQPPEDGPADAQGQARAQAPGRGGMRMPESRAEVEAMIKERFATADANHDGLVTREEMGDGPAGAPRGGEGGPARRGPMFDRLDANRDGKLSVEELSGPMLARFDRVDTDHDGKISPAEREAMRAAMRARWQERREGGGDDGPPPPPPGGDEPPQG